MTKERAFKFAQQAVNKAKIAFGHEAKRPNIPDGELETLKDKIEYALLVQRLVHRYYKEEE